MAWKPVVYKTNHNALAAYVEDEDTGITIHLKKCSELGVVHKTRHGYGDNMNDCLMCKHKLLKKANVVASTLNLQTDEVEVY